MYSFDTIITQGDRSVRVLLVQAAIGQTLGDLMNEVRRDLAGEDPVILRLPVEEPVDPAIWSRLADPEAARLMGDTDLLFGRSRNRSVHVLSSFGGQPYLSDALPGAKGPDELGGLSRADLIAQLREAEFAHLVRRSKALLTAPPDSVFKAPSGYMVHNFVRVGNIQADRDALDAIAFWILEHMGDRDAIVIDTWSISSIAFNTARVAAAYYCRPAPRVEMLPGYNDGSEEAMGRARAILDRVAQDVGKAPDEETRILILISATQSGSLAKHFARVCEAGERAISPTFLALFALRKSAIPRLSDLVDDPRFAFSAKSSTPSVVEIDPQIYFPLTYKDVDYRLMKDDAQRHREFFDAYVQTNVIRVHANDERSDSAQRHHAIRLDLMEILYAGRFPSRLDAIVETFSRQKAILAPPHSAAQKFAQAVAKRLKRRHGPTPILALPGPEFLPQVGDRARALELLHEADADDEFLILDDYGVGTARIAQIDKQLRTMGFAGRANYLVGIQTNEDPAEWEAFVRRLSRRAPHAPHTVQAVEQLPLPDHARDGCPWCAELALYSDWVKGGPPLPAALEQRRARLAGAGADGLSDDALLHPQHLPRPALGPRSFYVKQGCTQAHVFAAASAALQTLRTVGHKGKPKLGPRHFPIATVLHHEDYLNQKWTDTVLRAAFLRAGTRDELVWTEPARRKSRKDAFTSLLRRNAQSEHDLVLEVLIAAACGKVELDLEDEQFCNTIESRTNDGSAAYILDRLKARKLSDREEAV